jgi:hypothetical protein
MVMDDCCRGRSRLASRDGPFEPLPIVHLAEV